MNDATNVFAGISVKSIPNLDAPPSYRQLQSDDPLPKIMLPSGHIAIHITKYEDVRHALSDNGFIRRPCNAQDGPSFLPTITPNELLLNNDMPDHVRLRKVIAKDFSAAGVNILREKVFERTTVLIDAMLAKNEPADLFLDVLDDIPSWIDCQLMGINADDRTYYRPLTHVIQIADSGDIPDLLRQFWLVYDYLTELVEGKRPCTSSGLIKKFIRDREQSDPPLSDKELVGILLGILIGGDQNILTVLTKIVYTLLAEPRLWSTLIENPHMIPETVEELLRLIPLGTISAFPRIANEDVAGRWGVIPKGSVIYADAFAANRDPDVFANPLAIIPGREAPRHLQFGYGMHNCMGAALARMEIIAILETLIQRLPNLRLAVPAQNILWHEGVLLRRPVSLLVKWEL